MQRKRLGVLQNFRREKQCSFWRHSKKSSIFIRMPVSPPSVLLVLAHCSFIPLWTWRSEDYSLSMDVFYQPLSAAGTTAEWSVHFINSRALVHTGTLHAVSRVPVSVDDVAYWVLSVFVCVFACVWDFFFFLWHGLPALLDYIWPGYSFREETGFIYSLPGYNLRKTMWFIYLFDILPG